MKKSIENKVNELEQKFFNEIDLDDDNQTAAVMAEMEELAREL